MASEQEFEQQGSDEIFKPLLSRIPSVVSELVNNMDEETRFKLKKEIGLKSPDKSIASDLDNIGEQPLIGEKTSEYQLELPAEMHVLDHDKYSETSSQMSIDLTDLSMQE